MNRQRGGKKPYLTHGRGDLNVQGVVNGFLTFNRLMEVWRTYRRRIEVEKQHIQSLDAIESEEISENLENSNLGTLDDAWRLGLVKKAGETLGGVYLGHLEGHPLFLPDRKHLNITGMSGSMKSLSIILPNIISLGLGGESTVFVNVKGHELYNAVKEGRGRIDGQPVMSFDHLNEDESEPIQINPLFDLIEKASHGRMIVDDAWVKTQLIFTNHSMEGANSWISDDAKKIVHMLLIEWAYNCPDRCWLGAFWDFAALPHETFGKEIKRLENSLAGEGFVSRQSMKIYDQYGKEWCEQFEWVMDNVQKAFKLYALGSVLRRKRCYHQFDPAILTQELRTVSFNLVTERIDSHGDDFALMMDFFIKRVAGVKDKKRRVCFVFDEFSNIKKIGSLKLLLRLFGGLGLRLITAVQDREAYAQYEEKGEKKPYYTFESNSVTLTWGVDGEHASQLSRKAGNKTVKMKTHNANASISADSGGLSGSEQVTPALPESEIAQDFQGKAILDVREKIFKVERFHYSQIDFVKDYIQDV